MKPVKWFSKIFKLISFTKNIPYIFEKTFRKAIGLSDTPSLFYITPNIHWSTDWDGYYITRELQNYGFSAHVSSTPHLLSGEIIHYCDLGTFAYQINQPWNKRNQIVMTIFHGNRSEQTPETIFLLDQLLSNVNILKAIVTSCSIMKNRLIEWGINSEKIKCIPLGIDLSHFRPASPEQKITLRQSLGIPSDALCIGSFQKDGMGWENGLEPKWVKGPDVFLRVVQQLKSHYKIYILLSAPARGYIKKGLEVLEIPYKYIPLKKYWDIVSLYQALDLYLVTSREEGGPKAILEAMACGIPIVSTRVGMAPDIIVDNFNGLTAENENIDELLQCVIQIIETPQQTNAMIKNGLNTVKNYQWSIIARKYFDEVYAPLLK